ncbi:DUF1284 domain-containing protein [Lysinibacillus sp. BW-2-10]|uniref:DUF1284 domain-containing protein n=1 Tax=Lysinibacillus sp. BW-2-10 TaxID=2590030 RepID=UPI001180B793|nr:DUF1284 domain-containing protein [Lysinibacillus sp. BW-2-10]TSI10727.1 DUF1284 domain-containing protein [Lysinibacillus sp. BW-2-10]
MYKLRGHHILCLLGYRGMGYSKEYVENMTQLHQLLRANPQTTVLLVEGPDYLCDKYPNSGEYHCQNSNIYKRDQTILEKLGLRIGEILTWKDIEERVSEHIIPTDIGVICESCSWRSYGVCEEGIQRIKDGIGLLEIK